MRSRFRSSTPHTANDGIEPEELDSLRKLAVDVLRAAVEDFKEWSHRSPKGRGERKEFLVLMWFFLSPESYFECLCEYVDLEPDSVRRRLGVLSPYSIDRLALRWRCPALRQLKQFLKRR